MHIFKNCRHQLNVAKSGPQPLQIGMCKNSMLCHKGETWTKKVGTNFDVTMESLDGAETCDLVGLNNGRTLLKL